MYQKISISRCYEVIKNIFKMSSCKIKNINIRTERRLKINQTDKGILDKKQEQEKY